MIAGSTQTKTVYLPSVSSCLTKLITIKELSVNTSNSLSINTVGLDIIDLPSVSTIGLSRYQAVTLQSFTSTVWTIIGSYSNPTHQTVITGTPTVVNASGSNSLALMDLRTASKVIQLPNTFSTIGTNLFLTVKDQYGFAGTNAMYLSTPSSMFFEGSSMYSTLKLTTNFASIDLLASSNIYSILNLYP
jgi:hypothetical protein